MIFMGGFFMSQWPRDDRSFEYTLFLVTLRISSVVAVLGFFLWIVSTVIMPFLRDFRVAVQERWQDYANSANRSTAPVG